MDVLRSALGRAGRYVYNLVRGRYETADGTPIPQATLNDLFMQRMNDAATVGQQLFDQLDSGAISLTEWREAFSVELRRAHFQTFALGRGGWNQMDASARSAVAERLTAEYDYLREFAAQIANGDVSPDQLAARMQLYTNHLQASFWEGRDGAMSDSGYTEERRVLNPGAAHCDDCVGYAEQGWQPIGTLPVPGEDCQCIANCQCDFEYQ